MRTTYDTKEGIPMPDKIEVRLYDANGGQVGTTDADAEPDKEGLIESGGKTYVWNQRNGQWREARGSAKSTFKKLEDVQPGSVMSATATPEANASAQASGKGDK